MIKLKKGAKVKTVSVTYTMGNGIPYQMCVEVLAERDILFDAVELGMRELDDKKTRIHQYSRPYPIYAGRNIVQIEWEVNDTNESTV